MNAPDMKKGAMPDAQNIQPDSSDFTMNDPFLGIKEGPPPDDLTSLDPEKSGQKVGKSSPLAKLQALSITDKIQELKAKMLNDVYVLPDIAILGQWTVIYAAPNSGKTLLTLRMLADTVKSGRIDGNKVFYINADDGYRGGVEKGEIAKEYGFHMLIPGEFSINDLPATMRELAKTGEANGAVLVLDTLKKFVDLMEKSRQSEFAKTVREFLVAGGTVISLAHVNKNKSADGKSIREGTADIQNDADCTFVLDVVTKENSGEHVVIFRNDKNRGDVAQEVSFKFVRKQGKPYRALFDSVTLISKSEAEAVMRDIQAEELEKQHGEIINTVKLILRNSTGPVLITELVKRATDEGLHPRRDVAKAIRTWMGKHWITRKGEGAQKLVTLKP